ncbi:MAG: glycosyltransferase family 2 protein [Flavisolibacter sp.]
MNGLTVVIITRNEEQNIVDCIRSARLIAQDIVIVDSGSVDSTVDLARAAGARVFEIGWEGYGYSRNFGAVRAKNPWILALDADERVSQSLADSINKLTYTNELEVFRFRRKNFLDRHEIRYGTLGFETVTRIYNRDQFTWDLSLVHEKLEPGNGIRKMIGGYLDHYGLKNYEDYASKSRIYARLSAEKYFTEGRRAGWIKRLGSPVFNSIKSYFFQLGFLEGLRGIRTARMIAYYSWLKYYYLQQMHATVVYEQPEIHFKTVRKIETVSN